MMGFQQSDALPVAVIGCGRMGRLHARVFSEIPTVRLAGVYDADEQSARDVATEFGGQAYPSVDALLADVQAVSIATPTATHADLALQCIKARVPCLIEKPLARDVVECERIVAAASQYNVIVQVGHIERFNPVVRAMSRLNIQPRFMEVTRISPLTFRSIDVGVVLDMMIHDIDIVLKLADSKVAHIDATGVSVLGDVEDICNARIRFENGCVANLTASRLALKTERRLRVFSSDAYVSLDYQKRYGIVARRSGNLEAIRDTVARIRSGEIEDLSDLNYTDLVNIEELQIDDAEPLRSELDAFIASVLSHTPPPVTALDGLAAVSLAQRIVEVCGRQKL